MVALYIRCCNTVTLMLITFRALNLNIFPKRNTNWDVGYFILVTCKEYVIFSSSHPSIYPPVFLRPVSKAKTCKQLIMT